MTDFSDFDDDSTRQRQAGLGQIAAFFWRHLTSQPWKLAAFLVLYIGSVACDLALPWLSGKLVEAISNADHAAIDHWLWWFSGVAAGVYLLRNTAVRFHLRIAVNNMARIVNEGFGDVQRFSAQWHGDNFAGATVRRVSRAMWAYDTLADTIVWFVLPAVIVLGGLSAIMLDRWPMIGVFFIVSVVVFVGFNLIAARYYIHKTNMVANSADTAIGASLADSVSANTTVKAFGAEAREAARFAGKVEHWRSNTRVLWDRYTDAWFIQNMLLWGMQIGLLVLVVNEWRAGNATPGDAAFALTAFFLISGYLRNLGESVQNIQKAVADIEDVVAYSLQAEEVADPVPPVAFVPVSGAVRFDRVSFAYRGQDNSLYQDFSLDIAPGETVALVGPTGSGKSTFVRLIMRLYDVDQGAILIDGQDVRAVTQSSLRGQIALVPQDPEMFHRSVRENIAYARPDASQQEIEDAARQADAHDFISKLPKGYETEVGERGVKLSGGERQRVALARAFLADARLLILDEATSSLDNVTEQSVQQAMKRLRTGRTTILIAHRLSTVRDADRILVFDKGRVVEQGRHAELIGLGGTYARLNALAVGDMID
jgi:ATP-binding cassette, subfamily B, bacterial